MYVIKRRNDGKYVSKPGSKHSYTKLLQYARVYVHRENAEQERCGNEHVVRIEDEVLFGYEEE